MPSKFALVTHFIHRYLFLYNVWLPKLSMNLHTSVYAFGVKAGYLVLTKLLETIDLSSANILRLNPIGFETLVREEYRIAYDNFIAASTPRSSRSIFLVTGHPGIGLSISPATPSLSVDSNSGNLSPSRAMSMNLSSWTKTAIHQHAKKTLRKGIWVLSDCSNERQLGPCSAFLYSAAHILHVSSPSSDRRKRWAKKL